MKKKNLFPLFCSLLGIVGIVYVMTEFIIYQLVDVKVPNFVLLTGLLFISAITSFVGVSNIE